MRTLLISMLVVVLTTIASAQTQTITPGNNHTNLDGVTATNNTGSGGDITMNPASGSGSSSTVVKFKNNATGSVSGLDDTDTVEVAHGANATVTSDDGGTVDFGSGGSGTVTNSAAPGGKNITVKVGDRSVTLAPGNSVTVPAP